ncbi:MAG: tryptophan--tRNA ligase [Acidimicrobiales bacterium]
MSRVFSGIQPTGDVHLGNYLGALKNWVTDQHSFESVYCIVDLHAITIRQDPAELRQKSLEMGAALIAVGLDPDVCIIFLQSQVHQHAELSWLLECTAGMGELRRMVQFKDKAEKLGASAQDSVSVGLFTYPVLQTSDILLYDTDRVPVGEDQRQHLELTRDIAQRFNTRYGKTFVIPEAFIPKSGAKVMDLQNPTAKMSKSTDSPQGTVLLFEDPASIMKKLKRAVTDSETEVRFDPEQKPGVSNLLTLLGIATGRKPQEVAKDYTRYGDLKVATGEAIVEMLLPIQARYTELMQDPATTLALLESGADKATEIATVTMNRARDAMGFVPRTSS